MKEKGYFIRVLRNYQNPKYNNTVYPTVTDCRRYNCTLYCDYQYEDKDGNIILKRYHKYNNDNRY